MPGTLGAELSVPAADFSTFMLYGTTFASAPAFFTSAAVFSSVTATTVRPPVSTQLPAVRAEPSFATRADPLSAGVCGALSVAADVPGDSLAMAAWVTMAPPSRSPPTAANRVTRRMTRRRACLMPGSRTPNVR